MTVAQNELNSYRAQGGDGGRRSKSDKIPSGAIGALVERITATEYAGGYDRTYKIFCAVDNDAEETLYGSYLYLDAPTAGSGWATIYAGTPRDDASDHTSPRLYGVAFLSADYTAGDPTIEVDVEDASIIGIFVAADDCFISDKISQESTVNNREMGAISGTPSVSGTTITITLATPFANSYAVADGARFASAIDVGDIACSYDNFAVTRPGSYDDTTFPVILDNLGTIEQSWTIEMLDTTTFNCTGDVVGTLITTGSISADYAPVNPINGKPYLTLSAGGHGGSPVAGDTIAMQTHGPEYGFYLNVVGPAGSSVVSGRIAPVLLGNS